MNRFLLQMVEVIPELSKKLVPSFPLKNQFIEELVSKKLLSLLLLLILLNS
jgi:hypothetical protein